MKKNIMKVGKIMNIDYNDIHEKLEYYCNKCHRGIGEIPPIISEVKYCAYCGHKFNFDKVNKIRQKIKRICFEEGH